MAIANRMSVLLNKIEMVLGVKQLNLPEDLRKEHWADPVSVDFTGGPIALFTIPTFSRMYPNKTTIYLDNALRTRDGWYILDEHVGLDSSTIILGCGDIDFQSYGGGLASSIGAGYGVYMPNNAMYSMPDIIHGQMSADINSLFGNANNIYVEFKEPNLVKLSGPNGINFGVDMIRNYPINIFIEHNMNLMTIPPTKMDIFEELATADVARFLYKELLRYDNLDTIFGNVDLKLDDIANEASKRDDIISRLNEGRVSAANDAMPMIMLI